MEKNKRKPKRPVASEKKNRPAAGGAAGTLPKKCLLFCGCLLAVAGAVLAAVLPLRATGFFLRRKTVAETPHYRVDGAMYSYYFYSSFYDALSGENAELYKRNGITEKTDLKKITYSEGKSWFSFFESVSAGRLQSILEYAEAAADANLSLSDEGKAELEKTVARLREAATANSLSFDGYLARRFGVGVKEKDVRAFLSLYLLAGEMAEREKDDVDVSPEEIEALRQDPEFSLSLSKTSLFYYICMAPQGAASSEKEKAEAKENAKRLRGITDPQSFVEEVRRQEEHLADHRGETLTDELFEEIRADFSYLDIPYGRAVLIDENIEARRAGETLLFAEEEKGSYGVVLVIEPLHLDETPSYRYQKAVFSEAADAEAAMSALCGTWKVGQTVCHSDADPAGFLAAVKTAGGKAAGDANDGAAADTEDPSLAEWLRDGIRQAGDILLSEGGKTVWYFEGEGPTAFEKAVKNRILREKYAEIDRQIAEKYASVTVKEKSGDAVATRRGS